MGRLLSVIVTVLIMMVFVIEANAKGFSDETLKYVITYKWGLIHKDSGKATLKLTRQEDKYKIILAGQTDPWADHLFKVRDTLLTTIKIDNFQPLSYTKISHEGGKYGKDDIKYIYSGNKVTGECTRYRDKKGDISRSSITLSAVGPTFDMLSIFYYLRTIDFSQLVNNKPLVINMFSGTKTEKLTIRSLGIGKVKLRDNTEREACHIQFNFTIEGKKKSSDDIDAWISLDSRHIPLLLSGKLPLGAVKCYYVGG